MQAVEQQPALSISTVQESWVWCLFYHHLVSNNIGLAYVKEIINAETTRDYTLSEF